MTDLSASLVTVLLAVAGASAAALGVVGAIRIEPSTRVVVVDPVALAARRRPTLAVGRRTAIGVSAALGAFILGVLPSLIAASAVFGWRRGKPVLAERARKRQIMADLPDVFDLFVLMVHAGLTPRSATDELGRRGPLSTRPAFVEVSRRCDRGEPFVDALRSLTDGLGGGAAALVDLVGSSERYGLPIASMLEQLSAETRATRRRLDEAAARSLPVKLSFPLVVCTLPSFVMLAIAPAVMAALSSLGGNAW